jgi:hypothetical protein
VTPAASAIVSGSPTPIVVTQTEVVTYQPPARAADTALGACFGPSVRVQRLGAWSCTVGNEIFDPCFGDKDSMTVVCIRNPWEPDTLRQISLLNRACEGSVGTNYCDVTDMPPSTAPQPRPWAFETAEGSKCGLQRGTTGQYRGESVPYGCQDGATILGYPTEGTVWTVRVADVPSEVIETVSLVRVWQ